MAEPIKFVLTPDGATWTLARDDRKLGVYSHIDRATHEAVRLARELHETGQPAQVFVHVADGKIIEVDVDPDVTQAEARLGPEALDL